ncbi:MAG: isopeptide-forming domain-containing fimbrial protein [Cyanobacteria bacterium J06635_1]
MSTANLAIGGSLVPAQAQVIRNYEPRYQETLYGQVIMFGNAVTTCSTTLGTTALYCDGARSTTVNDGSTVTLPNISAILGRNIDFNRQVNNTYYMDYVDIDSDSSTFNSSSATYTFPVSADQITWAGLYWSGDTAASDQYHPSVPANWADIPAGNTAPNASQREQILLKTPVDAAYRTIQADNIDVADGTRFSAFAEVTDLVRAGGSGTYFAANVQTGTGLDRYGGWTLVVVYENPAEVLRSVNVFDGYVAVDGQAQETTIDGFLTPPFGNFEAWVGAIVYEGDVGFTGDQLLLDGDGTDSDGNGIDQPFVAVQDSLNPADNFFNSTNSLYETPFTNRNPNYPNMLAMDIDIVEARDSGGNRIMQNGATSAGIRFTTSGDVYYPTAFLFSVEVFQPILTKSFFKTVTDDNGETTIPGDTLTYEITYENTGNDPANDVVITDLLDPRVNFIPDSLEIVLDDSGGGTGAMSDAADSDQAEYDSTTHTVVFRTGNGANGTQGGRVIPAQTVTVRFQVQVDPNLTSTVPVNVGNQATIDYTGEMTGEAFSGPTDDPDTSDSDDPTSIAVKVPPIIDLDKDNNSGVGGNDYQTDFVPGSVVNIADADIEITDADSTQLSRAVVTLANPQADDQLTVDPGALPTGISIDAASTATQIILIGTADIDDYETAIRLIQFDNASTLPDFSDRTVTVQVSDELNLTSNLANTTIHPDGSSNFLLVKRITAINNSPFTLSGDDLTTYTDTSHPYDDNTIPPVSDPSNAAYNPGDPNFDPRETSQWPMPLETWLPGAIDGGAVITENEIEYTIYYLSAGEIPAHSVLICDYVPAFTDFVADAYNGQSSQAANSTIGADLSVALRYNGTVEYHTGADDGDRATYFAPGVDPADSFPNLDCEGDLNSVNANPNGAVVVDLGNLTQISVDANQGYGYVRFKTRVR